MVVLFVLQSNNRTQSCNVCAYCDSPGAYGHDIPRNRHVECNESFGGRRSLKSLVPVKCTNGITDVVGYRRLDS